MVFGLFWLVWILFETMRLGIRRPVAVTLFSADDAGAASGNAGGLANAIYRIFH